jgi:hypothetical protein
MINMKEEKEYVSLNVCGHCGAEDKEHCEKVVFAGYGDILCFTCRCLFEDSIRDVAKYYLSNKKGFE